MTEEPRAIRDDGLARCDKCGETLAVDVLVPDEVWARISPRPVEGYKGGGLLCAQCIVDAALSLRPAETRVKVKALEWDEESWGWSAFCPLGEYRITRDAPRWYVSGHGGCIGEFNANVDSPAAAVAAAQSDFEKRIKASISEPARAEEGTQPDLCLKDGHHCFIDGDEPHFRCGTVQCGMLARAEEGKEPVVHALRTALVAMRLASALPGVSKEYDFGPAVAEVEAALGWPAVWTEDDLCEDCPPKGYHTDATRCKPCPRRAPSSSTLEITEEAVEAGASALAEALGRNLLTDTHLGVAEAVIEASLPFLSQTGGWRDEMDKLWRMFIAQCEAIEDYETPTASNEHEIGFYSGQKSAAKRIRRSVDHPKYNSADFPLYASAAPARKVKDNG